MSTIGVEFGVALRRISAGENVTQAELAPHLLDRSPLERAKANYLFAGAYLQAGNVRTAAALAFRAATLDDSDPEVYHLAHALLSHTGRLEDLLDLTRAHVFRALARGDRARVRALYRAFHDAAHALSSRTAGARDAWADEAVHAALAQAFSMPAPPLRPDILERGPIRLGYVLAGEASPQSTLVRVALSLMRSHDRSRFEFRAYTVRPASAIRKQNPTFDQWIEQVRGYGGTLVEIPDGDGVDLLMRVRARMIADGIDIALYHILILDHYILSLMRPAPLSIGVNCGNPRGYTARHLDTSIVFQHHGQMEATCDSALLGGIYDFELLSAKSPLPNPPTKGGLGIPPDASVIVSGGQSYKFQSDAFWEVLARVLAARPGAVWVLSGISREEAAPWIARHASAVDTRIFPLGWRTDFVDGILPLADIVVDTFPAGGGQALYEAMSFAKPCLSFTSDYFRPFSNRHWSPCFEVLDRIDLAIPFGDHAAMEARILALLDDRTERERFGTKLRDILKTRASWPSATKALEREIDALVRRKVAEPIR